LVEGSSSEIRIVFNNMIIAETRNSKRVLETSHPPVYYLPRSDVRVDLLRQCPGTSWCEWKGRAGFYSVHVGDRIAERAAWYYPEPADRFALIKDHIAFFCRPMDACYVDGEKAEPQPGEFYGGWITRNIIGPFKGAPGTMLW
jgi:uncharacterized protein (DUF427 family)